MGLRGNQADKYKPPNPCRGVHDSGHCGHKDGIHKAVVVVLHLAQLKLYPYFKRLINPSLKLTIDCLKEIKNIIESI